jgi:hypothetical protein
MGFIRSATGDKREGDDGKTGDDDFFHNWNVGLMVNEQSIMTPSIAPTLWGVTLSLIQPLDGQSVPASSFGSCFGSTG